MGKSIKTKQKSNLSNKKASFVLRKLTAILLLVVGLIISVPFIVDVLILGNNYHYIELWPFLRFLGMMFGAPMFMFGVFGILSRNSIGTSSSAELDLARIRYTVETEARKK